MSDTLLIIFLGLGITTAVKIPTKVNLNDIRMVACGSSHTLALSVDGQKVWSFGSGESGKLGHGNTDRQLFPKVLMFVCSMTIFRL